MRRRRGRCVSGMGGGSGVGEGRRRAGPASRSGVPAAASVSARTTMRRASSILKALSPEGRASASAASAARREGARVRRARRPAPPPPRAARQGLRRDAAEREARRGDRGRPPMLERRRGRDDREGVGGALAQLEVAGMAANGRGLRRQAQGDDQLAGRQHGLALRACRRAGGGRPSSGISRRPAGPCDLDHGVERHQRHAEVGRMRGDAGVAPAEDGMEPVLAARGRRSRRRARGGCRRWPCRRNRRSGCAAAGCRRRSRRCAAAPRRRTAAPRPPPGRRGRSRGRGRGRRCGPARRCGRRRPAAISIRSRPGRRVTSTSRAGRATPIFIRSSRLVPAAR